MREAKAERASVDENGLVEREEAIERIRLIEEQKHSQYLSSSVVELRLEREKGKRLVGGNECKLCTIWLPPTTYHHSL